MANQWITIQMRGAVKSTTVIRFKVRWKRSFFNYYRLSIKFSCWIQQLIVLKINGISSISIGWQLCHEWKSSMVFIMTNEITCLINFSICRNKRTHNINTHFKAIIFNCKSLKFQIIINSMKMQAKWNKC